MTTYAYDATHHQYPVVTTDAIGTVHASHHALTGAVAQTCGPRHTAQSWQCTRTDIDALGRVVAVFAPILVGEHFGQRRTVQYVHDDWATPITTVETSLPSTSEAGRAVQYRDGFGHVAQVRVEETPGVYRVYETAVDPLGHVVAAEPGRREATDAFTHATSGRATTYIYDAVRGAAESVTYPRDPGDARPAPTATLVDHGPYVEATDEEGVVTRHELDDFGRVARVRRAFGTAAEAVITYERNGRGEVTRVVDPDGLVHAYERNLAGWIEASVAPDGGRRSNQFDRRGALRRVEDARGVAVAYDRDESGRVYRVATIAPSSSAAPVYEATDYYDASTPRYLGLVRAHAGAGVTRSYLAYDALGNATVVGLAAPDATADLAFTYDLAGRLRTVTYPDRDQVAYHYNLDDTVASITSADGSFVWAAVAYDDAGRRTSVAGDPGLRESYAYDVRDRPVHARSADLDAALGPLADDRFVWSDTSRLIEVSSSGLAVGPALRPAPDVTLHDYDALGRLESTTRNGQPLARYSYHRNGRPAAARELVATTYAYDADRLVTHAWDGHADTFTYDANGSALTQTLAAAGAPIRRRDYTWDDLGRLVATVEDDESLVAYEYLGGDLVRTRYDSPTVTRDQLEVGPWSRLDVATGRFTNRILLGDRVLYEDRDGAGLSMPHRAMGSSVVAVTSDSGAILRQEDFYPYGRTLGAQGTDAFDQRYHGIRADHLTIAGGRAYDPDTTRWIARDKILATPDAAVADPRILDAYGYSFSAPTNYRDPSGCCLASTGSWCHERTESQKKATGDGAPWQIKVVGFVQGVLFLGMLPPAAAYLLPAAAPPAVASGTAAAAGAGGATTATTGATVTTGAAVSTSASLTTAQTAALVTAGAARTATSTYSLVQSAHGAGPTVANVVDILMPGGHRVGTPGTNAQIRFLPGGVDEARALLERLTQGAQPDTSTSYPGVRFSLPGGGHVGLRVTSTSGPPTIDVQAVPGVPIREIKFR